MNVINIFKFLYEVKSIFLLNIKMLFYSVGLIQRGFSEKEDIIGILRVVEIVEIEGV